MNIYQTFLRLSLLNKPTHYREIDSNLQLKEAAVGWRKLYTEKLCRLYLATSLRCEGHVGVAQKMRISQLTKVQSLNLKAPIKVFYLPTDAL
jgi:hypothetical protein